MKLATGLKWHEAGTVGGERDIHLLELCQDLRQFLWRAMKRQWVYAQREDSSPRDGMKNQCQHFFGHAVSVVALEETHIYLHLLRFEISYFKK